MFGITAFTWILVAVILLLVSTFALGVWRTKDPTFDGDDELFSAFLISFVVAGAWPLVLAMACLVVPFIGVYYLGKWIAQKL